MASIERFKNIVVTINARLCMMVINFKSIGDRIIKMIIFLSVQEEARKY